MYLSCGSSIKAENNSQALNVTAFKAFKVLFTGTVSQVSEINLDLLFSDTFDY